MSSDNNVVRCACGPDCPSYIEIDNDSSGAPYMMAHRPVAAVGVYLNPATAAALIELLRPIAGTQAQEHAFDSDNLRPCPFCRGSARLETIGAASYTVYCSVCGAQGPTSDVREAVGIWNERDAYVYAWKTRPSRPER
jgi:hypothetical protein